MNRGNRDAMKKILIVDDQEKVRILVRKTLSFGDYEILEAGTGQEAVDIARAEKPEVIIMDIMMPGSIDGLTATRLLKLDPETKNCFIVMLTAKGQQTDREKGFQAGADDYFAKPFRPRELIAKVDEILGD